MRGKILRRRTLASRQWDRRALEKLMQRGSMTVREIMESVASDQFGLPLAQAWVANAVERGLIAKAGGSNEATRYGIMAMAGTLRAFGRDASLSVRRPAMAIRPAGSEQAL